MIDTEDRISAMMHRATGDLSPDGGLIADAMRAGDRRRRGRRIGYGAAVLASLAVVGTGIAAVLPDTTQTVVIDEPSADGPSYGANLTAPAKLRVPTPEELSASLADALPGESTEVSSGHIGESGVRAKRVFHGASVEAMAYEFASDGREIDELEETRGACADEYESRFTGCVMSADGWALWTVGHPDVAGVAAGVVDARVTFYRTDGLVIDLSSSNAPDVLKAPVAKRPVLSRHELVELARTYDWFPGNPDPIPPPPPID